MSTPEVVAPADVDARLEGPGNETGRLLAALVVLLLLAVVVAILIPVLGISENSGNGAWMAQSHRYVRGDHGSQQADP